MIWITRVRNNTRHGNDDCPYNEMRNERAKQGRRMMKGKEEDQPSNDRINGHCFRSKELERYGED